MKTKSISLDTIDFDSETQPRAAIVPETVEEYRQALESGAEFPPVTLFQENGRYWIGDGFHRVMAYRDAGHEEVPAIVLPGGKRDAILHAVGANAAHGMRRTNADKRRAVTILLRDNEWRDWSDHAIAERCKVSHAFVGSVRRDLFPTRNVSSGPKKSRDGRTIDTSKIGTKPKVDMSRIETAASPNGGKSKVNGVVTDDPPDIAARRAAGSIPAGVVVEVTEPDEDGETVETVADEQAEAAGKEADLPDAEWLATLPLSGHLDGAAAKWFRLDALLYRSMEPYQSTYAHHARRALAANKRAGGNGEYAYRLSTHIKLEHPKHWHLCAKPDEGGCGGTGTIPLIGQCPKCRGRGYWIL